MEMNRKMRFAVPLAAVLLVGACTPGEGPTGLAAYPDVSHFALNDEANGPGACLLAETQAAGFLNNVTSLNCTSNDVDIAFAEIAQFRLGPANGDPIDPTDPFVPLAPGDEIECTPGQKIQVQTTAFIQNNAQARYDFGFWLNLVHGGSALTGESCEHYNLVPGSKNASVQETGGNGGTPDACLDMAAKVLAEIDLGVLNLECPGGGATSLDLDACAAWSNGTTGSNDRLCPIGGVQSREAYGRGTTPGTTAKCRCEPLNLPIVVKAGVELVKEWVGTPGQTTLQIGTSAGDDDIASQETGAGGVAPLTTGSIPVDPGTYHFSEVGGLAGYTSTLSCVKNGGAAFTPAGAQVALIGGDNLVCTFTNTRDQGDIELRKVWVGVQGQTTLNIGTSAGGSQTVSQQTGADGGGPLTTGAQTVNTGTYFVSETGGLDGYTTELACTRNGNAFAPGVDNAVVVNKDDEVICTFTNTLIIVSEWCSPGYWRNAKWDFWTFLGISENDLYSNLPDFDKPDLKGGIADASLIDILNNPQTYGGAAFNYVGSYLSGLHPDIDFTLGSEVPEDAECPINAFGVEDSES